MRPRPRWRGEVGLECLSSENATPYLTHCSAGQYDHIASLPRPNLVKAAVEGRLPRGIGIERLRDRRAEWSRQFESLGLNLE
jgi:hypothetical protein